MAHADRAYGSVPPLEHDLTDMAGALSKRERERVRVAISKAHRPFPQVHFAVVISKFPEDAPLGAITFWIFNRGQLSSPMESGASCRLVLFVLDTTAKRASCMTGYGLEPFLPGDKLEEILQTAQTALRLGQYANAITAMLEKTAAELKAAAAALPQMDAIKTNAAREREDAFVY